MLTGCCVTQSLDKVQGFTPVCPAQKSILSMATTEKKVRIFNRINHLICRLLGFRCQLLGGQGRGKLDVGWTYWHGYCCICAVT